VIHACLSPAAGGEEISAILRCEKPSPSNSEAAELGTHDYSKPPAAIALGAAYEEEDGKAMREACTDHLDIPWLIFDKSTPLDVPMGPECGKAVVARAKLLKKKLQDEGRLNGDGIYYY
jgi:hypothetical protein